MRPRPPRRKISLGNRRRRRVFSRVAILSVAAALVVGVCSWLAYRPQFQVTEVVVTGTKLLDASKPESVALRALKGTWAFLIPRSNVALVSRDSIEEDIKTRFPIVASVDVETRGLRSLVVTINERSPDFLWCRGASSDSECYAVDNQGLVFTRVDAAEYPAHTRFYGFFVDTLSPIGQRYLLPDDFEELHTFLGALKVVDLEAKSVTRSDEGKFRIALRRGSEIIVDTDTDLSRALANISSLLSDQELRELFGKTPLPFEYIDLRLDSKVFYKRL